MQVEGKELSEWGGGQAHSFQKVQTDLKKSHFNVEHGTVTHEGALGKEQKGRKARFLVSSKTHPLPSPPRSTPSSDSL